MNIYFEKTIPLPIETVFEQFSDINFIPNIAGASSVRIKNGKTEVNGVGAIRKIKLIPFILFLQEEITKYIPNDTIEYTIINFNLVKHHVGVLKFEYINENTTHLRYTIEFETHNSILTKLICWVLARKINKGLDRFYS